MLVCADICATARDGVCDDGGDLAQRGPPPIGTHIFAKEAAHSLIRCAYGTDCKDCGPRPPRSAEMASLRQILPKSAAAASSSGASDSVAVLASEGKEIRAAWTATQPPFIMTYTDPRDEYGVSRSMDSGRAIEPAYNLFWRNLASTCCANGGLVLDVGSNYGYYALFAAKMGCRVIAWEPVPQFRAFLSLGAQLNNVSHLIHIRHAVASDKPAERVQLAVPQKGIAGTASLVDAGSSSDAKSFRGTNVDVSVTGEALRLVDAPAETLDGLLGSILTEHPCAMKIDVEGHEPSVIAGASTLLKTHPPKALLAEYSPGVAERARTWSMLPRYSASLAALRDAGYRMWHLGSVGLLNGRPTLPCLQYRRTKAGCEWGKLPLPPLREIGDVAIQAEQRNTANMASVIKRKDSFHIPWDLHPLSLHAEFSHNTDLIAVHTSSNHSSNSNGHSSRNNGEADIGPWMMQSAGEVGLRADDGGRTGLGGVGLGGSICRDVMHAGSMLEVVGRLCLPNERAQRIADAVKRTDQPWDIKAALAFHEQRKAEATRWRFDGPCNFRVVSKSSPLSTSLPTCHLHLQFRGPKGLGVTTKPHRLGALVTDVTPQAAKMCGSGLLVPNTSIIVALNGTYSLREKRIEEALTLAADCMELTIDNNSTAMTMSEPPPPSALPPFIASMPSPPSAPPPVVAREAIHATTPRVVPLQTMSQVSSGLPIAVLVVSAIALLCRRRCRGRKS